MIEPQGDTDFFISYRGDRVEWARWINWVIRSAGYTTIVMEEFPVGTTWTSQMRNAAGKCRRLIPLYSDDYWQSGACREEFDAYWTQHLKDEGKRFLLPLEVQKCAVPKMHAMLLACRLHELEKEAAHTAVLSVLKGIQPVLADTIYNEPEPQFPGKRPFVSITDWPDDVPSLRWPLANHQQAREAFASLVTRTSSHRLLALRGESETGKTHLTRQFFTNAQRRLTGCICGRFDFKGTGDLQASLTAFAEQLQVPVPALTSTGLVGQLGAIFRALSERQQPTLLIFDAYEFAGETERWIRENLLLSLHRSPWLRVVIAGQRVPECFGHSWDEDTKIISLQIPQPEDWYAWGLENNSPLDLSFAQKAHAACNGRASILAGLFGPNS